MKDGPAIQIKSPEDFVEVFQVEDLPRANKIIYEVFPVPHADVPLEDPAGTPSRSTVSEPCSTPRSTLDSYLEDPILNDVTV